MYDQMTMNPSLYSQFMGGNQSYGNMNMASPQIQQALGNQPNMSQMAMGAQNPSAMTAPQNNAMDQMAAYRMMAQGLQGMAPKQQMQQPQLQIMRDQNQFRFAGTPQQQMAQALRRR
jgi:hypothetical protein